MLIQDYFKKIQDYKLSDAQKNKLYERILLQTQKPVRTSIFASKHFFTKVVGYAILLIFVGLTIYIPYLGQVQNNWPQNGSVFADYIANIVQAQGDFYISSDGRKIDWNNIGDWDTVTLASGGSIVFHVNGQVEGKITWPASFTLYRQGSGYAITLIQGDFVEVAAMSKEAPEFAVVSPDNKVTTRSKAGDKYHFVITKKDKQQLVTNKGQIDITVTNNEAEQSENNTFVTWKNPVVVTPEGKITLAENQLFATTARQAPITTLTKDDDSYDSSFFNSMLTTNKTADEPQATNTTSVETNENTATQTQSRIDRKALRNNLLPQFVWVDLKYITYYYLDGQQLEYQRSFDSFLQRIQRTYTALGVPIPTIAQLNNDPTNPFLMSNMLHLVAHLAKNLPEDMPENDKNTVKTLGVFFTKLSSYQFGEFAWQWLYLEDMFAKIQ